jgi:histidyl-tRNA synthetase
MEKIMSIVQPRIASGFPEYLPEEQIAFNKLVSIIRDTYERYGFSPIDTPDLELREVLLAKGGGETEQQVYEFSRGKNDFCLRFDLTVPLARYTAQHQANLVFPFRRYHIGKVHRAERAQAGRFREFYQCDIDIIGSNSVVVDAEIPAIINEIFDKFDFGEFTIRLNNRKILDGFFESILLADKKTEVMRLVDKVEKMSAADFHDELKEVGLDDAQVEKLVAFTDISGDNDSVLNVLASMDIENEVFKTGVAEINTLVNAIRSFGVPESRFKVELKIARGLDYYTGTVYETILNDYPEIGSVCSGGRYDNLASHYTQTDLPGVGISIGLSRLFYQLSEIGVIKTEEKSPAVAIVIPMGEMQLDYAIEVSAKLRAADISNILYTEQNAFKKKMRYADAMGFKYAIIIGSDEVSANQVSIKNMKTGESSVVDYGNLSGYDWIIE